MVLIFIASGDLPRHCSLDVKILHLRQNKVEAECLNTFLEIRNRLIVQIDWLGKILLAELRD